MKIKEAAQTKPQPQPGSLNTSSAASLFHSSLIPRADYKPKMWKIFCVSLLTWVSLRSFAAAQEYLPPKVNTGGGGGGKKPVVEPTLPANYEFTYDVQDSGVSLDFGHNEKRKDDRASGSYHVLLPDGRTQLVEYEAGPDGYRPQIMYMGTATYPTSSGGSDKFEGYHYNAASTRQTVRQAAPRGRQASAPAPAPAPAPPLLYANATQ